jgi:RimJ/RimL family protein N-acetyltransferase
MSEPDVVRSSLRAPPPDPALRPPEPADRENVRRWLRHPLVVQYWGPPAASEARLTLALESPSALCRIVTVDAEPVGWVHAVDAALTGGSEIEGVPVGAYEIDWFIAVPAFVGLGLGLPVVVALVEEVFATTLAPACCAYPRVSQEQGVRLFERAGFRWLGISRGAGPAAVWVMVRDRPAF